MPAHWRKNARRHTPAVLTTSLRTKFLVKRIGISIAPRAKALAPIGQLFSALRFTFGRCLFEDTGAVAECSTRGAGPPSARVDSGSQRASRSAFTLRHVAHVLECTVEPRERLIEQWPRHG